MPPLRLITFDMTGTLLKFRTPVMEQYADVASKFGLCVEPKQLQTHFTSAWKLLELRHPNFGQRSIGWKAWWQTIVVDTLKPTTEKDDTRLLEIAEHLIAHFETPKAWYIVEGGLDLLQTLKSENLELGVISNFDPRLHAIMDNLNISKHFSFVLTSYEIGLEKPNRRIFDEALRKANVKETTLALHVGNDLQKDWEGAIAAGWKAILVADGTELPYKISNISEVSQCVKIILNS